jgi:crotonobetaine/carnitine-CoA ligase
VSTREGLTPPVIALRRSVDAGRAGLISFEHASMMFAELDNASTQLSGLLRRLGTARGDRVLGLIGNRPENLISWFGASKCGAIWVPTNTYYRGDWLAWQIVDSEPSIIVAEARYLHRLADVWSHVDRKIPILVVGTPRTEKVPATPLLDFNDYRSITQANGGLDIQPTDISHLMYTSGTTGRAKGCKVSHNYLANIARLSLRDLPREPGDIYYTPLPLFHTAATGMVAATLAIGGSLHLAEAFSVSRFWPDILKTRARLTCLMGSMLTLIANAPATAEAEQAFGQLDAVTGGPFPEPIKELWRARFGVRRAHGAVFGATEAHYIFSTPDDALAAPGSCGQPNGDTYEVRIVGPDDSVLGAGEVGELVVRPRQADVMFSGYWNNDAATLHAQRNLWYHTGDFGYLDADGCFFFSDRAADRIRRGGENLSSQALEQALRHPDFADLAVHGVPSELGEDEIKIVAALNDGSALEPEQFIQWAIGRVPRFAVPRYVEFRSTLPRNPVGKIMKFELRCDGVTASTWDRVAHGVEISR